MKVTEAISVTISFLCHLVIALIKAYVCHNIFYANILYFLYFLTDINQYTVQSKPTDITSLKSPNIFQRKGCFTFQYYSNYYKKGRLFVFIKATSASKRQALPFWSEVVKNGKWHKIDIFLDHESGFNQASRLLKVLFRLNLGN